MRKRTEKTSFMKSLKVADIEIGGRVTMRNQGVKLSKFKKNISSLALYSLYQVFITRNEERFNQSFFLLPPSLFLQNFDK